MLGLKGCHAYLACMFWSCACKNWILLRWIFKGVRRLCSCFCKRQHLAQS